MSLFRRQKQTESAAPAVAEVPVAQGPAAELSEDYLNYLYKVRRSFTGKWLRVGDKIILAVGVMDGGKSPTHSKIIELASLGSDDLKAKIIGAGAVAAASGERLLDNSGIVDAGKYDLYGDESKVDRIDLYGASTAFGRGEDEAREETIRLAMQKLGPAVAVTTDLPLQKN